MMRLSDIPADAELVRTHVDYGSPGGYVLGVARVDGDAYVYADTRLVATARGIDDRDRPPIELRNPPTGLDVPKLLDAAEAAWRATWNAATGESA